MCCVSGVFLQVQTLCLFVFVLPAIFLRCTLAKLVCYPISCFRLFVVVVDIEGFACFFLSSEWTLNKSEQILIFINTFLQWVGLFCLFWRIIVIMLRFPSLVESDALLKDSSERTLAFFMTYYISQFVQKNISFDSCRHLRTLMEDKNKIKKKLVKFFTLSGCFFQNTVQTKRWRGNKPTNRRRPSSSSVVWSAAAPQAPIGPLIGRCRPWIMQACWREVRPLSLRAPGHSSSPSSPSSSPSPAPPPPTPLKFYFFFFLFLIFCSTKIEIFKFFLPLLLLICSHLKTTSYLPLSPSPLSPHHTLTHRHTHCFSQCKSCG